MKRSFLSLAAPFTLALAALSLVACEEPQAAADPPELAVDGPDDTEDGSDPVATGAWVPLLLETRAGTSAEGWSFAAEALVPAEEADIVLFSWDCGARGRWVTLVGVEDVEVCPTGADGSADLEDYWQRDGDHRWTKLGRRSGWV